MSREIILADDSGVVFLRHLNDNVSGTHADRQKPRILGFLVDQFPRQDL